MPDLYPYQQEGVAWLTPRRRSFLFDEMGLGKTPQAICASAAAGARSMLVICPAIARTKWAREIHTWSPTPHQVHIVEGGKAAPPASASAVVMNYDVLTKYVDSIGDRAWDTAIIDEGHFLKNREAKRTRAAYGREGILRKAGSLMLLTGTPARNDPSELWTHLRTFYGSDMKREGVPLDYWGFVKRYCKVIDGNWGLKIVGSQNLDELKAFLKPRMLRRTLKDVDLQLPPISFEETPLPNTGQLEEALADDPEIARFVASMRAEFGYLPEDEIDEHITAAILGRADQHATFRRLSGLAKADPVADMIEEDFDEGLSNVIVFAYHRGVIERIAERLRAFGCSVVYGGMSATEKDRAITQFNELEHRVFVGQLDAVGTAIDLVAAADVVFAELAWVPGDNAQALKRAHRIGQKRRVRVRFPSLAGTIDEAITNALRRKTAMLKPLFG